MRFIIDLFRCLIYFYCAAILIGVSLGIFLALDRPGPSDLTADVIFVAAAVFSIFVLHLGGIAILVSLHDRHVESTQALNSIAASLEKMVAKNETTQGAAI